MKDAEIIQAFLTNDQRGIRQAYEAWQAPFRSAVLYRTNLDEDYLDDAYQEAVIRLQQHILTGRISADNLNHSLLAYLKEIGYYAALEIIRGRRELPESRIGIHDDEDENHNSDNEVDPQIGQEISEGSYDPMAFYYEEERERVIREQVMRIGAPCAPLLLGFYWEEKSMDTIASELGYSNADSAKSQKAKCMKKVMNYVKQNLIALGYGY
jgi:DNA-directed RNA polymerase specialized sigma24 family protein